MDTPVNKYEEGQVLLINKPLQWTSFDVIQKLRNILRIKKIGHAGTLDPLATGLLIICTGKFTKRINEFMAQEKEYTGTFTLGATTPTYDLESEPENYKPVDDISDTAIQEATKKFSGEILQVPPAHSAIKMGGTRVYELARQGIEVKMEPRKVTINEFVITAIDPVANGLRVVHFKVVCTTGTYIRSLAKDFGDALGCGAFLSNLCRTRIGTFSNEDAMTPESFREKINKGL